MNKKSYWCPRCGRMFKGIDAYRKHVNSRKCKINDETDSRTSTGRKGDDIHQTV